MGLDESWMMDGECHRQAQEYREGRSTLVNMFYNERNRTQVISAKRLCSKCNVQAKCLDYALKAPHDNGIWGGTTPRERSKIRRGDATMETFIEEKCDHTVPSDWVYDVDANSTSGCVHKCPKCSKKMKTA